MSSKEIVEQIESKKKCSSKLPTWFNASGIYFPNKLNIEQTSSELTAKYKSELINGKSIVDVTGGFGVDCYYFSKKFESVIHCDLNENLSKIVKHNYAQLDVSNIETFSTNGIEYVINSTNKFDWIYIDPSRRNDVKGKVFLLKDCLPDVPENLSSLFKKSSNILIKTSPILDLKSAINELEFVKEIHIVAVKNEVKELLFLLEKDYTESINIKTVNILKQSNQTFNFELSIESNSVYSQPLTYLFEPNSAILKSGGFQNVSNQFQIAKLHQHSHLYTSENLITFPGRRFKIKANIQYDKKQLRKLIPTGKANITTRNFPQSVMDIRKKTKLKDGGKDYLFFTTNLDGKHIVLVCEKL
ncbi:THUMP-like domain-containing protein [Urechidicola vernalis]|uniref:Class I SAM-dependent methyltransferase n=1 Tax=Urechidicola vernalis TaxID=3075600 RepID=A0ABU2Y816_9FLAO|nr:class I SAM-dependent methyltransferase [Urechidicola sp. P050]MDT0554331.1 class I SAM-dependent methyltransferase [Urechidicola sp. P050]